MINKSGITINWNAIIIGVILVILLNIIFVQYAGNLSGYLEYLIASIIVGFIAGENLITGFTNGAIASIIGGTITLFIEISKLLSTTDIIGFFIIFSITIVSMIFMGFVGGLTGSLLKRFSKILTKRQEKTPSYLQCKSCSGQYILQSGELPGDFESCSCGGELEFYDTYGRKRPYTTNYPKEKKEMPFGTKILILIVVVIFALYYLFPFFMFSVIDYLNPSAGIYLFPTFFAVSIAVILILLWYAFIRK